MSQNELPDVQMEVNIESIWVPKVPSETPWTPLGRFGDHVGSFVGLLGPSVELLGNSLGALGGSLGGLGSDVGSIFGLFVIDSGAFFGSQARPIMKRCFLGSQTTFCCFFIPCRKCGDRAHSKKPNVFATFS